LRDRQKIIEDPIEASYQISWDDKVVGTRVERELKPCPGSHTDK
jgi:hypothetical protein